MKVNFSQKIVGPDGNDLDIDLGKVSLAALNAPSKEPLALEEAVRRGNLAIKVCNGGEHEITPEEASKIRSLLPLVWTPLVVARAAGLLA